MNTFTLRLKATVVKLVLGTKVVIFFNIAKVFHSISFSAEPCCLDKRVSCEINSCLHQVAESVVRCVHS